jgi:surfeit locus 1 family protein
MGAASISKTLTRKFCNGGGSLVALGRPWVPLPPQPQAFSSSCSFSSSAISSSVPESQSASSSQVHGMCYVGLTFSIIFNFPWFVDLSWRGLVLGNERRWGWSKLLLFLPGAITFGLGTWQIFRRQDKVTYTQVHTLTFAPIRVCKLFQSFR